MHYNLHSLERVNYDNNQSYNQIIYDPETVLIAISDCATYLLAAHPVRTPG